MDDLGASSQPVPSASNDESRDILQEATTGINTGPNTVDNDILKVAEGSSESSEKNDFHAYSESSVKSAVISKEFERSSQLKSDEIKDFPSDNIASDPINNGTSKEDDNDCSKSDEIQFLCQTVREGMNKRRYGLTGDDIGLNSSQDYSEEKSMDENNSPRKKTKLNTHISSNSTVLGNSANSEDIKFVSSEKVNDSSPSSSRSASVRSSEDMPESPLNSSRRLTLPYYQAKKPELNEYLEQTNKSLQTPSNRSTSDVKACHPAVTKVGRIQNLSTRNNSCRNQVELPKKDDDDDIVLDFDGYEKRCYEIAILKKKLAKQTKKLVPSGSRKCDEISLPSTSSGEPICADRATLNKTLKKKINEKKAAAFKKSNEAKKIEEEDIESVSSEYDSGNDKDELCSTEPCSACDSNSSDIEFLGIYKSERPLSMQINEWIDEGSGGNRKRIKDEESTLQDEEIVSRKRKSVKRLQDDSDDDMESSAPGILLEMKNSSSTVHGLSVPKPLNEPSLPSSTSDNLNPDVSKSFGPTSATSDFISSSIPSYQPHGGFPNVKDDKESQDSTSPECIKSDKNVGTQSQDDGSSFKIHYGALSSSVDTPIIDDRVEHMPRNESSPASPDNFSSHNKCSQENYENYSPADMHLADPPLTNESRVFESQELGDICSGKFNSSSEDTPAIKKSKLTSDSDVMPSRESSDESSKSDDDASSHSVVMPYSECHERSKSDDDNNSVGTSPSKSCELQKFTKDNLILQPRIQDEVTESQCSGEDRRDGSDDDAIEKEREQQAEAQYFCESDRHLDPGTKPAKSIAIYDDVSDKEDVDDNNAESAEVFIAPDTFFDAEAELSGEDCGDEDDPDTDEAGDEIANLIDDDDDIEDKTGETAKLHAKQARDEDEQLLKDVKEKFLDDGDLTSDGARRSRKYAWKNASADSVNYEKGSEGSENEEEDDACDSMHQEKMKWKHDNRPQIEQDDDLNTCIGKPKMKMQVLGKASFKETVQNKGINALKRPRGSLLAADDENVTKSFKKFKLADEEKAHGSRTTRLFVFSQNKGNNAEIKGDGIVESTPSAEPTCSKSCEEKSIFNKM